MGNCFGRPSGPATHTKLANQSSETVVASAFQLNVPPVSNNLLIKPCASSATFAASPTDRIPHSVRQLHDNRLLIALFEGVGPEGDVIATWCHSNLQQAFDDCTMGGGSPSDIVKATLERLDSQLLAAPNLFTARLHSGAAATVALLDLTTLKCVVSNVGHVQCLLASVSGSFNAKKPEGRFLSTLHTVYNVEEKIRAGRKKTNNVEQNAGTTPLDVASHPIQGWKGFNDPQLTRAIGLTAHRPQPNTPCQASVCEHTVKPSDQALVVGTSGVWDVLSPAATALRTHLYEEMVQCQTGPLPGSTSPALQDNTARHLLYLTMAKCADTQSKTLSTTTTTAAAADAPNSSSEAVWFSVSDLQALPLRDPSAFKDNNNNTNNPLRPDSPTTFPPKSTPGAGTVEGPLPKTTTITTMKVPPTARCQVHTDLALLVISLRWQKDVYTSPPTSARTGDYISILARQRWSQIRMVTDYHRLYKREVVRAWGEAVEGIGKKAKARARMLEQQLYQEYGAVGVRVTPLMKVMDSEGKEVDGSLYNIRASTVF